MITCQACGAQLQRIQWTHLRYKCIGKYQNVAEYTNDFPNSPILTADLAIRTSITEENFIKKYGEVEGMRRFRTYCDKQAYSN